MTAMIGGMTLPSEIGHHRLICPNCAAERGSSYRSKNLSVDVRPDGSTVWICHRCGDRGGTSGETRIRSTTWRPRPPAAPPPAPGVFKGSRAESIWRSSRPIAGTLGESYLRARGCALPPADGDLRFAGELWHPIVKANYAGLVALVTDAVTGEPMTIHRTYLRADGSGKAEVEPQKMLMSGLQKRGGVIRLWPDESVTSHLTVAEGIETALTAAHGKPPAWSAVDAGNLAQLPLLDGIESLLVIADADPRGIEAADELCRRYANAAREVMRWQSPNNTQDLNDEARHD